MLSAGLFTFLLISMPVLSVETGITVIVNGNNITFESEPFIIDGRVMVPINPIAESLGWSVDVNEYGVYLRTHGDLEVIPGKKYCFGWLVSG